MSTGALFQHEMSETTGVGVAFPFYNIGASLIRWWHLVALMKVTNLLHWAMRTV
jgi:hypothetical protein